MVIYKYYKDVKFVSSGKIRVLNQFWKIFYQEKATLFVGVLDYIKGKKTFSWLDLK